MDIFVRILIFTNGIIIFFFLQFIVYGVLAYFYYFKEKKKLNLGRLFKIHSQNSKGFVKAILEGNISRNNLPEPPFITIVIPAREEKAVIGATIDRFLSLNYFKDKFCLLLVLDDKELKSKPFEETTHSVVYKKAEYYNKFYKREIIIVTSVPTNFDGELNGRNLNHEVPSTKPRALNWALRFVPKQTQILGFYDADSQPDPDTLLYVAYKYLNKKENEKLLLQGPVVQVRNYFYLKPFNKIYALAQAITHEWYLPTLLAHLPFIGGTNFFIEPQLLYQINGFNKNVLSEDLDLGCRLFIETSCWPEFMPYIATEQTPPSYKSYFHQRTRWASGYIQVLKEVISKNGFLNRRFFLSCMLIFYGILPWFAAQILAITSVGIFLVSFFGVSHIFKFVPFYIKFLLLMMNVGYIIFLFYYFNYALRKVYIFNNIKPKFLFEYLNFLLLPLAAVLGGLPYTYGFIMSLFTNNKLEWRKTIRTIETKN